MAACVERSAVAARGEFACVVVGQQHGWTLRLRLLSLNVLILDEPICGGVQYVSPIALGSRARLEVRVMPVRWKKKKVEVNAWRVSSSSTGEPVASSSLYHSSCHQTDAILMLGDELQLRLCRTPAI